ncbi:gag/pol protein [Cucumis melo var. makuwa]|uniref:Gag/pol protein n=1 Tax=Cucumis melo var. makuwa TaxID=1194695 RepID=A0A5D3CQP1_CUCMM|nr:gag/pol protein [Cucumis melo var. makuwa]TYK14111.1 gag/pol protein [Cucumis melo var. makuwa]
MTNVLEKKHEPLAMTKEITDSLTEMFGKPSYSLRHEAIKHIYTKRMKEGSSVREHVLDMMMHFDIAKTNASLSKIELDLTTLPNELQRFQTLTLGKGKEMEANVATTKRKFLKGSSFKNKVGPSKPKAQMKKKGKGKTPKTRNTKKCVEKGKCFYCNHLEHSKRNCPKYFSKKNA